MTTQGIAEWLRLLVDTNSFVELATIGADLPESDGAAPKNLQYNGVQSGGAQSDGAPYDGVIAGTGLIDGRKMVIFAQDSTFKGGSIGVAHGALIVTAQSYALAHRLPIIGIWSGGGARLPDGVHALTAVGNIFRNNTLARGVIPQISLVLGTCAGAACYSPALTDFIILAADKGRMFLTGPAVTLDFIGENVSIEELGGPVVHARNGVADIIASDDAAAISAARQLLSYLTVPEHSRETTIPSVEEAQGGRLETTEEFKIPQSPTQPYDVHSVLSSVFDADSFMELQPDNAANLITGFARLAGRPVAIIASQPKVLAGTIDADAAEKGARFITTAARFGLPIITFIDVPGFMPGTGQERAGIIRHGANLVSAYANAKVPKFNVIMRKAYGGAYIALDSMTIGATAIFAWPGAEISVMGAAGAVDVLHHRALAKLTGDNAAPHRANLIDEFKTNTPGLTAAIETGQITAIIEPSQTRAAIMSALRAIDPQH